MKATSNFSCLFEIVFNFSKLTVAVDKLESFDPDGEGDN